MKNYIRIGNYIFDYIVLSLILFTSALLVIPVYIGIVMVISFFENDQYKLMFKIVKTNIKPLMILTIIELFLGFMALLTIQMNDTGILGIFNIIVLVVIISVMTILVIYPPIIMIKMTVSFKQLLRNTLYLALIDIKQTLFMFVLTGIVIYMSTYTLWGLLLVVPYLQSISYISNKVLMNEKEKKENEE